MLHFGFVPLFIVKHLTIPFDPNDPKRDTSKKVPNLNHFAKLFRNPFSEHRLFPIKIAVIPHPNPANFVRDARSPTPNPSSLDATPTFMLNGLTCI